MMSLNLGCSAKLLCENIFSITGMPLGLSIDCGVEVMKLFGGLLTGNMSLLDPSFLAGISQSPAGKSKLQCNVCKLNIHYLFDV